MIVTAHPRRIPRTFAQSRTTAGGLTRIQIAAAHQVPAIGRLKRQKREWEAREQHGCAAAAVLGAAAVVA